MKNTNMKEENNMNYKKNYENENCPLEENWNYPYDIEDYLDGNFIINNEPYFHSELGAMIMEISFLYTLDRLSFNRDENIKTVVIEEPLIFQTVISNVLNVLVDIECEMNSNLNKEMIEFKEYYNTLLSIEDLSDEIVFMVSNSTESNMLMVCDSFYVKKINTNCSLSYEKIELEEAVKFRDSEQTIKVNRFSFDSNSLDNYIEYTLNKIINKIKK